MSLQVGKSATSQKQGLPEEGKKALFGKLKRAGKLFAKLFSVAISCIAFVALVDLSASIQTYHGWCGTPIYNWISVAAIDGTFASINAVCAIIILRGKSGRFNAICKFFHAILLIEFMIFMIRHHDLLHRVF